MIDAIRKWLNKPLPADVCTFFGSFPGCKMCWGYVGIVVVILGLYGASEILIFSGMMDEYY